MSKDTPPFVLSQIVVPMDSRIQRSSIAYMSSHRGTLAYNPILKVSSWSFNGLIKRLVPHIMRVD